MIKILALTRYARKGASSRMRFEQFIPFLAARGVTVDVSYLLPDSYLVNLYSGKNKNFIQIMCSYAHRIRIIFGCKKYDALWIEKELFPDFPSFFEFFLHGLNVPYVVDYDDAIFHNYDESNLFLRRMLGKKIAKVMRMSRAVICGNEYLASYAKTAGSTNVFLIPTVIDLDRYSVAVRPNSRPIVIGWIGSSVTVKYFLDLLPVFHTLASTYEFSLCVIGARIPPQQGLNIECKIWDEALEVSCIQNFDIGIMPLPDSPWERGKCGYKLIQYMACGLPVVASPVGVNQEIVCHGKNGFLATTSDEWINALAKLIADSNLRDQLGNAGRDDVEATYSVQAQVDKLAGILLDAASME